MLINYLKIASRVLLRRKFFTMVSLFGTGVTLLVLVVVAAMLDHMLSPLPPEVNLDRTLHVTRMVLRGEESEWNGEPGYGFLDRYCRDMPHVSRMAIFSDVGPGATFVNGEKVISQFRRTDADYWRILDFTFKAGRPFDETDVEASAPVAVITGSAGRRLFGDADPLSRTLEINGQGYTVIGVVEDVSRIRDRAYADIWAPITTIKNPAYRTRLMGGFGALLLADSRAHFADIRGEFQSRLPRVEMTEPARYGRMEGVLRTRLEELATDMAGTSGSREEPRTREFVAGIMILAFLFMLLPAINLINMNISRIFERVSEIGVRKAFGASSAQLMGQFIIENVVLSLLGGAIGLGLSLLALHLINESNWIPNAGFQMNIRVFLSGLSLSVIFGVLSGVYPAWRMAGLSPVDALKGGRR